MPWFVIAAFVVGLIASLFLAPKPKIENARASTLSDLNFPRAKEGDPKPWFVGKVRNKGPNTLWAGDFEARPIKKKVKTGLFSSKKQIVGYNTSSVWLWIGGLDRALRCIGFGAPKTNYGPVRRTRTQPRSTSISRTCTAARKRAAGSSD
jgi:hypothetical protein